MPLTPNASESTPPMRGPHCIEDLVDPVPQARAVPDELATQAADFAQAAEQGWRDHAGAPQTELADAGQPDAVRHIGLAALDLLDVLGLDQDGLDAGFFQGLIGRLPVDAGRFQHGGLHLLIGQPADQGAQAARQGTEGLGGGSRLGVSQGNQYGGRDLHLVNVQTRSAGMDDVQGFVRGHQGSSSLGVFRAEAGTSKEPTHILAKKADVAHLPVRPRSRRGQGGARNRRPGQFLLGLETPIWQRPQTRFHPGSCLSYQPRPQPHQHPAAVACYMPRGGADRTDHEHFSRWGPAVARHPGGAGPRGFAFRSNCLEVPDLRAIRMGWVRGFAFRSNCPAFPGSGPRT